MVDTERTRQLFSTLIQKPPLTDHLLQRPPFKFILDIINATIQNTGFLQDTFSSSELDSSTMKDKTVKVEFLQKLIVALNNDGSLKSVKASKIVAGKEPELTNLLLQKLAVDAIAYRNQDKAMREDENGAVNKLSNGSLKEQNERAVPKENAKKHAKHRDRTSDKSSSRKKTDSSNNQDNSIAHHKNVFHLDFHSFLNAAFIFRSSKSSKDKDKSKKKKMTEKSSHEDEQEKMINDLIGKRKSSVDEGNFDDDSVPVQTNAMMKDAGSNRVEDEPSGTAKTEDSGIVDDMLIEPVVTTALILGERNTDDNNNDNDDEEMIVEADELTVENNNSEHVDIDQLVCDEHGGLVRRIIETKKELDAGMMAENASDMTTSIFGISNDNDRERTKNEVNKMQKALQQLTQTTHPLAKLFDYVQEDVDSMIKEMDEWRSETKKNTIELRERNASSMSSAERLLMTLKELDSEIKQMRANIAHTKANILANEQKIRMLIQNL
ncbi:unnamed protein product [Anisakis simplex]|uniref:TRAF3-interacting protein 1 n=1 Tax=Anisakis simplex TaxID=6269 RepID=A0A0M3JZQ9_ANISI|nr:unnamed protein product [Anisakis simplex]